MEDNEFERAWRNVIEAERLLVLSLEGQALAATASAVTVEATAALPPEEAKGIVDMLRGEKLTSDDVAAAKYVVDKKIIGIEPINDAPLIVSFLFGFSERIVMGTFQKFEPKEKA